MGNQLPSSSSAAAPLLLNYDSIPEEGAKDASIIEEEYQAQAWLPSLSRVAEEIKELYIIALPLILTGLLVYGKSAVSMFFMGKLSKEALAGGSLSIGIANISGYSVIAGLATGMEAISSQACGAKQWTLMGQTLQRTTVILVLACIPISLLWLNAEPVLILCSQDPDISAIASTYLAFSLPDLVFQALINPLRIYLRTQNITLPLMLSAAFALAVHAPFNYVLVYHFNLGVRGIAMAVALTDLVLLVTLLLYMCCSGIYRKSWNGWSLECFFYWKPILSLALPSCLSVCLEWWWYELMTILSGLLANAPDAVATMGILIQLTSLIYIFPSALSQAVSTRVGNELGANRDNKAKFSSMVALSCAAITGVTAMSFTTTMRNTWGQIFATDGAILALTGSVMPVVGVCELGNCPQTTGCGVLRGCARPILAANINLVSFYGVGLPVGLYMGFAMDKGLLGLYMGLLSAQFVCAVVMVFVLMTTDWSDEAIKAKKLTGISSEEEDEQQQQEEEEEEEEEEEQEDEEEDAESKTQDFITVILGT